MTKNLTHRQQIFLSQFLDIYREMDQPVHYVTVAERLGIGNITVYELLRLLEERGLVRAEYHASPGQHGPGRPNVLFYPTQDGDHLINSSTGDAAGAEDWQLIEGQMLQELREGRTKGYEELLSSLLTRISERKSPFIYLTELTTILILSLAIIPEAPEIQALLERLSRIGLPQEIGLGVLGGMGILLTVFEKANRRSANFLLTQSNRYEEVLSQLNKDGQRRLGAFTREIVQIVSG